MLLYHTITPNARHIFFTSAITAIITLVVSRMRKKNNISTLVLGRTKHAYKHQAENSKHPCDVVQHFNLEGTGNKFEHKYGNPRTNMFGFFHCHTLYLKCDEIYVFFFFLTTLWHTKWNFFSSSPPPPRHQKDQPVMCEGRSSDHRSTHAFFLFSLKGAKLKQETEQVLLTFPLPNTIGLMLNYMQTVLQR